MKCHWAVGSLNIKQFIDPHQGQKQLMHFMDWPMKQWSHFVAFTYYYWHISLLTLFLSHGHQRINSILIQRKGSLRQVLTVICDFDVSWLIALFPSNSSTPPIIWHRSFTVMIYNTMKWKNNSYIGPSQVINCK